MKKTYVMPLVKTVRVEVEEGFAASDGSMLEGGYLDDIDYDVEVTIENDGAGLPGFGDGGSAW